MTPATLFLWPLYLACLPAATAWVFSWTEPDDTLLTSSGDDVKACTKIDNPVGNVYDWDPKGDNLCIFFYNNTDCTDPSAGYTCSPWPWANHVSGIHVLSYEVTKNGSSTDSTLDPSSSAAVVTVTPSHVSPSSSSAAASGSNTSSSSLSGGAIAGIVIGIVAGVSIAGVVLFLFLRKRKQPQQPPAPDPVDSKPPPSPLPSPGLQEAASIETKAKLSELQCPNQGFAPAEKSAYPDHVTQELPGTPVMSEMGSGVERAELDGSPTHGTNPRN